MIQNLNIGKKFKFFILFFFILDVINLFYLSIKHFNVLNIEITSMKFHINISCQWFIKQIYGVYYKFIFIKRSFHSFKEFLISLNLLVDFFQSLFTVFLHQRVLLNKNFLLMLYNLFSFLFCH